jgi:hypothetical protein
MNTLRINVVIILTMIAIFDVAMFALLPAKHAARFDGYRQERFYGSDSEGAPYILGRSAPRNYHVKHEERGFDIGPNRRTDHAVEDGVTYPIWSNSIGCFDIEHASYDRYVYLAGDSTAWGYTPFDDKFGTILERKTGKQILKCGVDHTGQWHQLSKLVEIVEKIGTLPETILLSYNSNDVPNDYTHPHSTVISGWKLDMVLLKDDLALHRYSFEEVRKEFDTWLKAVGEKRIPDSWPEKFKARVMQFSLTAQLANLLIRKAASRMTRGSEASGKSRERELNGLYSLPQDDDGKQWYVDNPFAQRNKEALLAFKRFAEKNGVRLIVALMPLKRSGIVREQYYEQVRRFLDSNDIEFIDPAFSLNDRGVWKDLFWEIDHHLDPTGNEVIAEILMEEAPDIFQ